MVEGFKQNDTPILDFQPVNQGAIIALNNATRNGILVDLAAGTAGGLAGRMVEYPFDTIKVRLQTSTVFRGPVDCFRWTIQNQGFAGLYRGISAPLVGAMLENSFLFMAFEKTKTYFLAGEKRDLQTGEAMVAGFVAGASVTAWLTPIELVKCRIQATHVGATRPMDVIRHVYKTDGVRGFFRGSMPTFLREAPGNAVYFGAYETAMNALVKAGKTTREDAPAYYPIIGGATAGICFTSAAFPADAIKSKMQTDFRAQSFMDTLRGAVQTNGVRGLYNGLGITLIRTVPANAAVFMAFEQTKKFLDHLASS